MPDSDPDKRSTVKEGVRGIKLNNSDSSDEEMWGTIVVGEVKSEATTKSKHDSPAKQIIKSIP